MKVEFSVKFEHLAMYEELKHSFRVLKQFQKSAQTSKHLGNILEHLQLSLDHLGPITRITLSTHKN
jgi:hypothetical protein